MLPGGCGNKARIQPLETKYPCGIGVGSARYTTDAGVDEHVIMYVYRYHKACASQNGRCVFRKGTSNLRS